MAGQHLNTQRIPGGSGGQAGPSRTGGHGGPGAQSVPGVRGGHGRPEAPGRHDRHRPEHDGPHRRGRERHEEIENIHHKPHGHYRRHGHGYDDPIDKKVIAKFREDHPGVSENTAIHALQNPSVFKQYSNNQNGNSGNNTKATNAVQSPSLFPAQTNNPIGSGYDLNGTQRGHENEHKKPTFLEKLAMMFGMQGAYGPQGMYGPGSPYAQETQYGGQTRGIQPNRPANTYSSSETVDSYAKKACQDFMNDNPQAVPKLDFTGNKYRELIDAYEKDHDPKKLEEAKGIYNDSIMKPSNQTIKKYAADGKGMTMQELGKYLADILGDAPTDGEPQEVMVKRMFTSLDLNKDGKIDAKELSAMYVLMDKMYQPGSPENGKLNGKIEPDNMMRIYQDLTDKRQEADMPKRLQDAYNLVFGK